MARQHDHGVQRNHNASLERRRGRENGAGRCAPLPSTSAAAQRIILDYHQRLEKVAAAGAVPRWISASEA